MRTTFFSDAPVDGASALAIVIGLGGGIMAFLAGTPQE